VNFASARAPCDAHAKGSFPPAGPDLSPVTWDYLGDLRQSQFPQLPISAFVPLALHSSVYRVHNPKGGGGFAAVLSG